MKRFLIVLSFLSLVIFWGLSISHPSSKWTLVQYEGVHVTSREALKESCNEFRQKSIFWVKWRGKLSQKLLRELPTVEEVFLEIEFPNKLTIKLKEKSPAYAFVTPQKSLFVAKDGAILNQNNNASIDDLNGVVIVKGFTKASFQEPFVNTLIIGQIEKINQGIRQLFPDIVYQLVFNSVNYVDGQIGALTLLMDDTLPIQVGSIEKIGEKLQVLDYYFKGKLNEGREVKSIDLRVLDRAIVSYVER